MAHRKWLFGLLGLLVFWAGIRFSDGTVLLAISRGLPPSDPSLQGFGQYLWDSPLKVGLLRLLPANVLAIGLVFGLLGVLPAIGLISNQSRTVWLTAVTVFLTPVFKVSLQNLGVGDGLIAFLVLCMCASANRYVISAATFAAALWHPQQSFFIAVSYFVALYCYYARVDRRRAIAVAGAMLAAAAVYLAYRWALPFSFVGRSQAMAQLGPDIIKRNLLLAPIAFAPLLAWCLLLAPRALRLPWLIFAWLILLAVVAVFTTDVTRVVTITSLPIILVGAAKLTDEQQALSHARLLAAGAIIMVLPPLNWSGLDYFLWPDLFEDLCKWHLYCGPGG